VKHGFISNGIFRASVVEFVVEKAVLEQIILQYCPVSTIPAKFHSTNLFKF